MYWILLIIGGIFEFTFTIILKLSEIFSKLLPTVAFVITSVLSLLFLNWALKGVSFGTAYAVWIGIGAVGTVITGIVSFKEPANFLYL
jgi:quaternary ammonium compound-resistance protein SugE